MEPIYLPEHVDVEEESANVATFAIHPYHPGYGPTVGNALRRVLLSSLPGCAITHMKIDGSDHEYSSIDGVREDLISIMLQLKKVRLSSTSEEPIEIILEGSGEGPLTAGDFTTPPEVTVANTDLPIATLTDSNAKITIRCTVEQGRGYVPAETRDKEQRDIGTVALDAIFTPVERVSFKIENVRVGKETDHHKLLLTIATDGTQKPIETLKAASSILSDHFAELAGDFEEKLTADRPEDVPDIELEPEPSEPENTLSLLQLPSRVHNALERMGITTVEQVAELTDEQIQDIPGLGQKAVEDITTARDSHIAANAASATSEDEA